MKWLPFFLCVSLLCANAERPPQPRRATPASIPTVNVRTFPKPVFEKEPTENLVLSYDEQLRILDPDSAWEKVTTAVVDMPSRALAGQIISVTVNVPTVVRTVTGVTAVLGYMSSELRQTADGVYVGRLETAETLERGIHRVQFYFRSSKGKTACIEKLLRIN